MRKILALLCILLFLTGSIPPIEQKDDIYELSNLRQQFKDGEENMAWKVTIKDTIDTNTTKNLLNTVENEHLVTSTFTEKRVQYKMDIKRIKSMSVEITINHYQEENQAEVVIEIQGSDLNEDILKKYDELVTRIKQKYLSNEARVFTCISATYSATINRNELENGIIHVLELQSVSEIIDSLTDPKKQIVLSGYSSHIKEEITTTNKKFNAQIVIQTMDNGKNSLMIGTPIIIDEY